MRWLLIGLLIVLVALQFPLWIGDGSFRDVRLLKQAIEEQKQENARLLERNRLLEAEVESLKHGVDALEERARSELGLIKRGESFYQIIPQASPSTGTPAETLDVR